MVTGEQGIALIKRFEGFRAKPYRCSAGVATIGYGNTKWSCGHKVRMSDKPITRERAEEELKFDLKVFETAVKHFVKVKLNQHQFDALVSFCYNVGPGNLLRSKLVKYINRGGNNPAVIKQLFGNWVRAGGRRVNGLVRRRKSEAYLFNYNKLNYFNKR